MRKILFASLFFVITLLARHAYSEDNVLAIESIKLKEKTATQEINAPKEGAIERFEEPALSEPLQDDDSDKDLARMRAYREVLQNKQKELEVIKLDLEKSTLLLKKKEAEKEIYQIDRTLPRSAKEEASIGGLTQDAKEPSVDPSDMKIQLLVISDNLREGQISLKGASYSFKEGDSIASKLTVEKIEPTGVTLRQSDGTALKLNFIN